LTRPRTHPHRAKPKMRVRSAIERHRFKVLIDSPRYNGNMSALARDINAPGATVGAVFRGAFRSIGNLEPKIARALGVSPEYLGWPQDPEIEIDPDFVPEADRWQRVKVGL
jgi:hypothetical protein